MLAEDDLVIGFVGLGIMGKGMVHNLVQKLPVSTTFVLWNRTTSIADKVAHEFPDRKIVVADSPAEVVRQSKVIFSMISDLQASEAVFDSPGTGILAGVSEGKIIVDCATLSPERMILEEKNVISKGGRFMEAPVSGSKIPAELGQLIFLCGGDEALFHYLAPAFEAMGKAKFLYGPVGRGSEAKLIINMMMGSMLTVFSEGLLLAQSLQLPTEKLLQAVDLGAIANPLFKGKGASILSHNFSANFPLKHAQKDMRLALEMASKKDVSLPTSTAANKTYLEALQKGLGDEDFCAVYKAL